LAREESSESKLSLMQVATAERMEEKRKIA